MEIIYIFFYRDEILQLKVIDLTTAFKCFDFRYLSRNLRTRCP